MWSRVFVFLIGAVYIYHQVLASDVKAMRLSKDEKKYSRGLWNKQAEVVIYDIALVLELRIPVSSVPSYFIELFRNTVRSVLLPYTITQSLNVTGLNFTTGCYPNSTGGLQCHCEEQFAWSCDQCNIYGACSNATSQTCGCINGLPSDGTLCEPITNITHCPPLAATSPPSTTTTKPMMTTMPTITTTQANNLTFTMDLVYNSTYNNPTSEVYKNTNNTIQEQCKAHISTLVSVNIIGFKSGSTIVDYAIRANSINDMEIGSVTEGVFIQLGKIYPVIFDSPLNFQPSLIFLGASVTITCGPPPPGLSFVTNWTAEWTLNGISIPKDSEHNQLPVDKGVANLTVKHVFSVDKGLYQCLLTDSSKVFHGIIRQKFNITLQKKPLIQVTPIKKLVKCEVNVTVTCSVNSPYQVEFIGLPAKGTNITNTFSISSNLQNYTITCRVINHTEYSSNITLVLLKENFTCPNDPVFGNGTVDYTAEAPCEPNYVGAKTAVCKNNEWDDRQDNCILQVVQELLELSQVTLFSRSGPDSVGALGEI